MRKWFIGADHLGSYMRRWIVETPWFSARIHNILRSDFGEWPHDHPWDFVSFIIKGSYLEYTADLVSIFSKWDLIKRKAEDLHHLSLNGPAWTLVLTGPRRRDWGYQTKGGWISHRFVNEPSHVIEKTA